MISAPADFIAAEAKKVLRPRFDFYFYPFWFPVGFDADGIFSNCSFTNGRIEVAYGSAAASWTSTALTNPNEVFPSTVTPHWTLSAPGYAAVFQYRTSNNLNQLAILPWVTMPTAPLSLYQYYQFKVTWTAIRAWAYDTQLEAEAASNSAWATDDGTGDFASYACDGEGDTAYLTDFTLAGEYQLNPRDIADPGYLNCESDHQFGSLVASDLTLSLINRNNKFSPGHANFIFPNQHWYRKQIRVEQYYDLPRTTAINIFYGWCMKWGPAPEGLEDARGPVSDPTVEVIFQDIIAKCLEVRVGVPDDDGTPRPWACGEILHEADQLADECVDPPDKTADGETGDTSEFSVVTLTGAGSAFTASPDYQAEGAYSFHSHVEAVNSVARGKLTLNLPNNRPLLSSWVMFPALPQSPEKPVHRNCSFMGLYDGNGLEIVGLYVGEDYKVWALIEQFTWKETSWFVNQDLGAFKRVSIGIWPGAAGGSNGAIKVWVNGDEVLSDESDWSGVGTTVSGFVGIRTGLVTLTPIVETWDIYFDDVRLYQNWERYAYRLPGYPYKSIGAVYQDGAIRTEFKKGPTLTGSKTEIRGKRIYANGQGVGDTLIAKQPEMGIIIFMDPANPPTGTIFVRARKNDITNPIDVFREVMIEAGLEDNIDEAACLAAKALVSDDVIGCYFEDSTLGDVLKEIGSKSLIDWLVSGGKLKPLAYTGNIDPLPTAASLDFWASIDPATEMEDIYSRCRAPFGWYDRNKLLMKKAVDQEALKLLTYPLWQNQAISGTDLEKYGKDNELDFSWGNPVASENSLMVQRKCDWWLNRFKRGRVVLENVQVPYIYSRVEVGDLVAIGSEALGYADYWKIGMDALGPYVFFLVKSKNQQLGLQGDEPPELSFSLCAYLGEQEG